MNRKSFVKTLSIITSISILLALGILYVMFKQNVLISAITSVIFILVLLIIFYSIDTFEADTVKNIQKNIDLSTKSALNIGNVGILVYSDDYEITWMSPFFANRDLDKIGEKILNWIPDIQDLVNGKIEKKVVKVDNSRFEINRLSNSSVLIFKDITKEYELDKKLNDESLVLGLIAYDNYDESQATEDEMTYISMNIKMPVIDYFKKFNCPYKVLKNNKLLLILNEEIFKQILDDRFSILTNVRKVSSQADLDVTLSMAFARGGNSLLELDETAENLLQLAQARGGDQIVVRKIGEDATFFGGKSEAREKLNKTKVRVSINSIKDLIYKSDQVIIVGHKDADADCIGAAICMSTIVYSLNKPAYIVCKSGGIEPMISDVLDKYGNDLSKKHRFIDESKAINLLTENTLVVMVDHHLKQQSNGEELLSKTNRIVILDHHRRKADLDVSPLFVYVEASASSTCEMVCEFLPYISHNLDITEQEANIMYLGLMIDTDRFRVRTGARTFDVLKQLRQYGADPSECDNLAQEPYKMVIERSHIINAGKQYRKDILISSLDDQPYNRSIASQACDTMVKAKEIEAAFVVCKSNNDETIISARSKGKINVQVILEKMNGGGHMTAAGLQRKDSSVPKLENELLNALDEYFKEA